MDTGRHLPAGGGEPPGPRGRDPGEPVADRSAPARRIRFSTRLVALTTATVVLAAFLAAAAILATLPAADTLDEIRVDLAPASRELAKASAAAQRAQEEFSASIASSGTERQTHIGASQRFGNVAAAHWSAYKRDALGLPAERRLVKQYDELSRASQEAGASAFTLADSPDLAARQAAIDAQATSANQANQLLIEIRSRFYLTRITDQVARADDQLGSARTVVLVALGLVVVVVVTGGVVMFRAARRDEVVLTREEGIRREEARRTALETQLQRGLEMEPTEESTYAVIEAALVMVRPEEPVELLVADSSRAHFHQVISTDAAESGPGCPVPSPHECPATNSGQTRTFLSSARLDACPFLRSRPGEPRAAACVPVNIAGVNTGVFHTTGPEQVLPDSNELAELELVARKSGERIGYLRVLAQSELQARVDALTGLVNRRSLEDHARVLVDRGEPFVVAFADVDHFKDLNDTFGHEAGDRALRLFGRILRDSVRPADVPARYGGEEFVVLLPSTVLADSRLVAERIRDRLRGAANGASVPPFTVSIGLAAWEPPEDFADTVARADAAMLNAKVLGRDRIVTSTEVRDHGLTPVPLDDTSPAPDPAP